MDDSALDMRRGHEAARRHLEAVGHMCAQTQLDRIRAVVLGTHRSAHAIGDLTLHHDRHRLDEVETLQPVEHDRRSDAVGQVGYELTGHWRRKPRACLLDFRARHLEGVLLDQNETMGKVHGRLRKHVDKVGVSLDGDEPRAFKQCEGERADTRTDFE